MKINIGTNILFYEKYNENWEFKIFDSSLLTKDKSKPLDKIIDFINDVSDNKRCLNKEGRLENYYIKNGLIAIPNNLTRTTEIHKYSYYKARKGIK